MQQQLIRTPASLVVSLLAALFINGFLIAVEVSPVAGGVTFRTDDNAPADYFVRRTAVFAKNKLPFGVAVNLVNAESDPALIAAFKALQTGGNDLMDHTPSHSNIQINFSNPDDLAWCRTHPGLDHLNQAGVLEHYQGSAMLRYQLSIPPATDETKEVALDGNVMTVADDAETARWFRDSEYLYFPESRLFVRVLSREKTNNLYPLRTPWFEDSLRLTAVPKIKVQIVAPHLIQPTPDARRMLAQAVRRVCDRQGLKYPVTYCAPGNSPHLTKATVKEIYGAEFGYLSAGTYPDFAARVFNEEDLHANNPFGMQWGDVADEHENLANLKNFIADGLAHNKVIIVGSHVLGEQAFASYFPKMDELLQWLNAKRIPVKSHAEWAEILYGKNRQLLVGNHFPGMDRDLDENGLPDGYEMVSGHVGDVPVEAGPPERHCITGTESDTLFRIQGLGGLPHGPSEMSCWLSGTIGARISVYVHGVGPLAFTIDSPGWKRYVALTTIPSSIATARVDFTAELKPSATVAISSITWVATP